MATLILTVIGDDRPGLVSDLSKPIDAHGASWERSQLAHLEGKFAGIVVVTVAEDRISSLITALDELDDLQVVATRSEAPAAPASQRMRLELVGDDHPGIVAEISAALAERQVSIEELTTDVRDAAMSGGPIFEARALLVAPATAGADDLREVLEAIGHDLMVDVMLAGE